MPQPLPGTSADELIALLDQLEGLLQRSELAEIEVEAGDLAIVLRMPAAFGSGAGDSGGPPADGAAASADPALGQATRVAGAAASRGTAGQAARSGTAAGTVVEQAGAGQAAREAGEAAPASPTHLVLAPLTGIFYGAPSPGAEPYVRVGDQVAGGQVIGLIEAMKLFNEIKSDAGGRVIRLHAENGKLIKAKQPLLEIEPI